jgi:menaquinone-dependent protoporphyrinogen oxidase
MMNTVLVTYTTLSGSTAEVARVVGEELARKGWNAEIRPLEEVARLDSYAAVVLGAPMIMGWHRPALKFLKQHRNELARLPFAIFTTGMSLTAYAKPDVGGVPVFIDENLPIPPERPDQPSLRERYANVPHYAAPILKATHPGRPVSLAFFGGRLEYLRLKLPARLFVMLIVRADPGDRRNWQAIRSWAGSLTHVFNASQLEN